MPQHEGTKNIQKPYQVEDKDTFFFGTKTILEYLNNSYISYTTVKMAEIPFPTTVWMVLKPVTPRLGVGHAVHFAGSAWDTRDIANVCGNGKMSNNQKKQGVDDF